MQAAGSPATVQVLYKLVAKSVVKSVGRLVKVDLKVNEYVNFGRRTSFY